MFTVFSSALSAFLAYALPKIAVFFGIAILSTAVVTPIFESLKAKALLQVSQNAGSFLNAFELMATRLRRRTQRRSGLKHPLANFASLLVPFYLIP